MFENYIQIYYIYKNMKKIIIKENDVNQRLDNFLRKVFKNIPKPLIFKLIRTKKIKVNNKKIGLNYRLNLGDEIFIYSNLIQEQKLDKNHNFLLAKNFLEIIYEDQNILVLNKQNNLSVHDDELNQYDNLINRIQKYLYNKKEYNPELENHFAPTLAHRIDRNTTGLVIAAKNNLTLQELNYIFKNRQIKKTYWGLVYGIVNKTHQTVKNYIKKHDKFVSVFSQPVADAKEAITEYKLLEIIKNKYSLLEINLLTGRTHQIRATFNDLNYPLVGEQKYINKKIDKDARFKNQCLVAYKIRFEISNPESYLYYLNKKEIALKRVDFLEKLK